MIDILNEVKVRLNKSGLNTKDVRRVASNLFKEIDDKSISNVLNLCEQLLEERKWKFGIIAYDWAFRMKKQYTKETFYIFEKWLKKYVRGWGDCDDFCTHAFGELLSQDNSIFQDIIKWTDHPDFWVRRAAAVILIYPIRKGKLVGINPFIITDRLMNDEHYLVLKGYGWMLKVLSSTREEDVFNYLLKNKTKMPRVSYRYALEKFDDNKKIMLMQK